jgi:plastocyanin
MKRVLSVALAFAAFAVVACGGDDEPTGGGPIGVPSDLVVVSGNGQRVATSSETLEPFVVQVTDGQGNPIRRVDVAWAVTAGGGTLSETETETDGFGETFVYLTAGGAAGENVVTATVDTLNGSPATFTVNAVAPASITIESGNDQMGRTGQKVAEPLVVEVLGTDNQPLPGAIVLWDASQGGGGTMFPGGTPTDAEGLASSELTFGNFATPYTITATIQTDLALTTSFNARATQPETVEVLMQNNAFIAPSGGRNVTILLGDRVQWRNLDTNAHTATSETEPENGQPFDSGQMAQGATFTFTPNVRGQWVYFCQNHPASMNNAQVNVE